MSSKKDENNPINQYQKVHLSKEINSTEPACRAKPTYMGLVVANDIEKVSCFHCKKIIESIKRSKCH